MTVTEPLERARAQGHATAWSGRHRYLARMLLSGGLVALVLLLRLFIHLHGSFPGDYFALRHFSQPWTEPPLVQQVTDFIGELGTAVVAGPLVLLSTIALWRHRYRIEAEGVLVAAAAIPTNALMKLAFGPTHDWLAWHRGGTNYPSGHTTFVTAVIGYLGVIAWRRGQREIAVAALATVAVAGVARIVSGTHIVGDVVGGYLLGAAFLIAALTWVRWRTDRFGTAAASRPEP